MSNTPATKIKECSRDKIEKLDKIEEKNYAVASSSKHKMSPEIKTHLSKLRNSIASLEDRNYRLMAGNKWLIDTN